MTQPFLRTTALAVLLPISACGATQPAPSGQVSGGTASPGASDASGREEVSITVYNQNFGLVRETRRIRTGTGRVELAFTDVAEHLQPQTVHIMPLGNPTDLEVLEQNYRYDMLGPRTLLDKYVGKTIKVYRFNELTGTDEAVDAEIVSFNENRPVLKINGELTFDYNGRFAFPDVPKELIAEPTLVWLLNSQRPEQRVELTYLTGNLNWHADYVMVINGDDTRGALNGWVTLNNQSGAEFEDARLKLVAGDVQRVSDAQDTTVVTATLRHAAQQKAGGSFSEEGFFEYHLYTLERRTTLRDKEQKQVSLLEASDTKLKKRLIFYGAKHYYRGRYGDVVSNQKVGVYIDLKNSKKNGLGMPLPKGTVRVYKADKSGAKQFIGEDSIDHTPRDEDIRIKMGDAFDVVASRKQTKWESVGRCAVETSWEIEIRNHKDTNEQVLISEPISGDWEILGHSHLYKKEDAHNFTFDVAVPANGKKTVTYVVRSSWC